MSIPTVTKYLKLPFQFDEKKLLHDLQKVLQSEWVNHYNAADYSGSWNIIALYSEGGEAKNINALPSGKSTVSETEIMAACDYFREVIGQFECPLLSVRLMNLGVGAVIKPHKDHDLGYENNCFRLHIPIATNPKVTFTLADVALPMQPGDCWYTNVNFTHSVSNLGSSDRIHLVIDGSRNAWSDRLFFSLAPEESFQAPLPAAPSAETKARMIEELRLMSGEAAEQLIKDLESKP